MSPGLHLSIEIVKINYSKCSKIMKIFSLHFSAKILVILSKINKLLIIRASSAGHDQTAPEGAV